MSDSGTQFYQSLDSIDSLLAITNEQEMSKKISQNLPKIFQIFSSFKNKLNFGQVTNNDINQIIGALKFVDTLNLFMEEIDVNKLKDKMKEIRDLLNYFYDFKDIILKQINYTEMTIIYYNKLRFRNLYFHDHIGLCNEIENEINHVYDNNKFNFFLFKQMYNIFWVVQNVLDKNKKKELEYRLKNMKIESKNIKEKRNSYLGRGYIRNDNYIKDYKNYSGYDYNDNFGWNDDNSYHQKKGYYHSGRGGYMNNSNRKYYNKKPEEKEIEIPSDPSYYNNKSKENEIKTDEINIDDNNNNIQFHDNNNNIIINENNNNTNNINGGNDSNGNNNIDDTNSNGGIRNEINQVENNNNNNNNNLDSIQINENNGGNGELHNINNINETNEVNKNDDIEILTGNTNLSSYNRNKKKVYPSKMIAVEVPINEEINNNSNNNSNDINNNNLNENNNNNGAKIEDVNNTNNENNNNNTETNYNNSNSSNYSYNHKSETNSEYKQYNNDFRENKFKNYYYNNGYKQNIYNNKNGYRNNYNRYNMRNNISGNNFGENNKKLLFVEIDANNNPVENKNEENEIINGQVNEINDNTEQINYNNEPNGEVLNTDNNINNDIKEENLNINNENKEENKQKLEANENNQEQINEIKEDIKKEETQLNSGGEEKNEKIKTISENINLNPEDDITTKISKSDSSINKINIINDIKNISYNIPETEEENLLEQENIPQENENEEEMSDDMPVNYEGQFKAFMIETQGIEPKGSYKLVTNNNFDENDNNDINEMDNNNLDENDLDEQINADIEKENLMSMNDVEQEKEIKLKECMEKLNIPQIIKDALDEIEEEEKQLKLKILHKLGDNYKNDAINHPIYTFYKNDFFKENPQIFSNELNSQINEYKSNPKLAEIPLYNYLVGKYYNDYTHMKDNDIIKDYIDLKVKEIEYPEYIWNNMQNFEKLILIPLYQKTIQIRKRKYNSLNHIYMLYEGAIKNIFKNSKDLNEVQKFGAFSNTFMIDYGENDIDICLAPKCNITYFRNTYIEKLIYGLKMNKLGTFREIKSNENKNSCIILKGEYIEKNNQKVNINIVITNKIPIYHSILLRLYALYDQRFHIMGIYLKYWSKLNGFNGPNYLPSYALLFMIIHFLQKVVEPKVLPNLQKIPIIDGEKNLSEEPTYGKNIYEYYHEFDKKTTNLYFENDAQRIKEYMSAINNNKVNNETVTNLLVKFFEYYSYCYDSNQKISIHKELIESIKNGEDNIAYSIDDPFDVMNNPGKNLEKDTESCKKFVKAMKKEVNLILNGEYVKRLEIEKERLSRMNKK